ncbi:MAG: hypothetical protein P8R54_26645 [Myxococcota bacterium]|nr:hypothetical protein [Myxococcota bacterium]
MRLRDHLRAALISLHIVAVVLVALPNPSGFMKRSMWSLPMVQDELEAWAERATSLGISHTAATLEDATWRRFQQVVSIRKTVLRPLRPYYKHCGTNQSWALFGIPQRYPSWLHIDLKHPSEGWVPIYISRDATRDWRRDMLDTERYRSFLVYAARESHHRRFVRLGTWLAGMAAADFPEAESVRLQWRDQRTLTPAEIQRGRSAAPSFRSEITVDLAALR